MDKNLLQAANGFMGRSSYEQREMNEMALGDLEVEIPEVAEEELEVSDELEVDGAEVELDVDAELEGEPEGDVEDLQMPVASAIRAIQLIINGEAETAEEALDMVQDAEEGGEEAELEGEPEDELQSDELGECDTPDEEVVEEVTETDTEEISEEDEEVVAKDEEVVEEEEEQYGESHSMFLKYSAQYL